MSNILKRFKSIIGSPSNEVITITFIDAGNGVSKGTTNSGVGIVVKGTSVSVGQRALVRDGEIVRKMPSLTVTEVEV